ncbi:MAG: ParA family protein [Sinimarinibacterium sp.]|jgi:chromosome partitioning protein
MIVLIGGEKGGSGKTTIAVNLAVALAVLGRDVVLIDADPQRSSSQWVSRRDASKTVPRVHCVERTGDVYATIVDLASRYAEVIVDAGGRDSEELRSAMLACHTILLPVRPSQLDVETVAHVDALLRRAQAFRPASKAKAFAVLSQCPTHRAVTESHGAATYLSEVCPSFRVAKSRLHERKVYRDAMISGIGVVEGGNAAASSEIRSLLEEVY